MKNWNQAPGLHPDCATAKVSGCAGMIQQFMWKQMLLAAVMFTALCTGRAQTSGWRLAWADEFDKPGLPNPAHWKYEQGFVRNNELQFYTPGCKENARVENGMLVIEARREQMPNPDYKPGASKGGAKRTRQFAEYTSASLTTRGVADWRYGRIEVRAKLPRGRGVWPAIWMLGSDRSRGWPACGEIDIMEYVGFDPDTIHGTIHTGTYNHVKKTQRGKTVKVPEPYADFHTYAVEWDATKIDFLVDGRKYHSFPNEHTGDDAWPFDKPCYLILNLAIGGAWGGAKGIDTSIFPQKFCIDYVRVYEEQGAGK